jgi:hypothetical protein
MLTMMLACDSSASTARWANKDITRQSAGRTRQPGRFTWQASAETDTIGAGHPHGKPCRRWVKNGIWPQFREAACLARHCLYS